MNRSNAQSIEADPRIIAEEDEEPMLLDEWQRVPAVFDATRRLLDQEFRLHRFLLSRWFSGIHQICQ